MAMDPPRTSGTDGPPGRLPAPVADPPQAARPPEGVGIAAASPPSDTLTVLAVVVSVVVALYVGRDLLVPLALGILLSFALGPLVSRLQRLRIGRVAAVVAAVMLATALLAGVAAMVIGQVVELARDLPRYEENIRTKIRTLKAASAEGGLVERTTRVVQELGREVAPDEAPAPRPVDPADTRRRDAPPPTPAPVHVVVEAPPPSALTVLRDVAGPVVGPAGTAGIVFVFVIFILLQREDMRDRLISLAGTRDLRRTTEALDEASQRVSRYLLSNLVVNLLYGVPVGLGLWAIGVPNPALWGLLATVLRFVPFLGPVIAASFPALLSVAVDPGWTLPLMTLGLFLCLELFSNNVMEPWIYGASTGLSSFAIIVAAIFWTALWGPVGLLLATPLTVCLVVLGKHVDQLRFLEVLLGSRPALPVPARIYQRLLARDAEEAAAIAEAAAVEQGRDGAWTYDALLIPALLLAEQDRAAGRLGERAQADILRGVESLLDTLGEVRDPAEPFGAPAEAAGAEGDAAGGAPVPTVMPAPSPFAARSGRILCVAARGDLDEAAALLLSDLLSTAGRDVDVVPCEAVGVRALSAFRRDRVAAVVLSYLNAASVRHPIRLVRRLDRHFGGTVPVMVAVWRQPMAVPGAAAVVSTLPEATALLLGLPPPTDADAPRL